MELGRRVKAVRIGLGSFVFEIDFDRVVRDFLCLWLVYLLHANSEALVLVTDLDLTVVFLYLIVISA